MRSTLRRKLALVLALGWTSSFCAVSSAAMTASYHMNEDDPTAASGNFGLYVNGSLGNPQFGTIGGNTYGTLSDTSIQACVGAYVAQGPLQGQGSIASMSSATYLECSVTAPSDGTGSLVFDGLTLFSVSNGGDAWGWAFGNLMLKDAGTDTVLFTYSNAIETSSDSGGNHPNPQGLLSASGLGHEYYWAGTLTSGHAYTLVAYATASSRAGDFCQETTSSNLSFTFSVDFGSGLVAGGGDSSAVPEPATASMMLFGLAIPALMRRRH